LKSARLDWPGPVPASTFSWGDCKGRSAQEQAICGKDFQNLRFEDRPILADALEDAGCDNAHILNHCRHPGEHLRGCWLVDLLLARK
jgi:hypothetical protein